VISRYRLRRRRAELEAGVARKRKLRRFRMSFGPLIMAGDMTPPFVISGPFEVQFPITGLLDTPVYTSSWYHEAPTVVNSQDAWNLIRSSTENFPLFWNRMY